MRKLCLVAALAAMMSTGLAQAQSTLRIGLQDDPDVLDPVRARAFVGRIVFASLCDKLVDITPDLKIVPQLAQSWTTSDDNKTLTFKLRKDAVFHDGAPVDAAAVRPIWNVRARCPTATARASWPRSPASRRRTPRPWCCACPSPMPRCCRSCPTAPA